MCTGLPAHVPQAEGLVLRHKKRYYEGCQFCHAEYIHKRLKNEYAGNLVFWLSFCVLGKASEVPSVH